MNAYEKITLYDDEKNITQSKFETFNVTRLAGYLQAFTFPMANNIIHSCNLNNAVFHDDNYYCHYVLAYIHLVLLIGLKIFELIVALGMMFISLYS